MSDALIRAEAVTRVYRTGEVVVDALREIGLVVERGEFTAIAGPSGSGKSTLLNLIGGLDNPTSGGVFLAGHLIGDMSGNELSDFRRDHIGFVFQSYNLIPQLDLLENILVPILYQDDPDPDAEDRARHLAERVGLADRIHHLPSELSGGQQQRAAIARALINDPALILADEATGNLDTQTTKEILELFGELHSEGKTILLVTHEQSIGERAEHILRLSDGHIESVDRNGSGS